MLASLFCAVLLAQPVAAVGNVAEPVIEPVTTVVPFPRGLVLHEGTLYVLARGRVRDSGGVDPSLDDKAGTIYAVDPHSNEPETNGTVFAAPTDPPFKLLDTTANPPSSDTRTDRPYCVLRFDPATSSFYICAFSGIDKAAGSPGGTFSKNNTDALLRYDTRTQQWSEIDRHGAGWEYPDADGNGLLKGPDNCLIVDRWLYAVAKDNDRLVRYDLTPLRDDAEAQVPAGVIELESEIPLVDGTVETFRGHSALAERDGFLYMAFRTTGQIIRVALADDGTLEQPVAAEVVARFPAWDPEARTSADITDMGFGPDGMLYVINAKPARVFRFTPDPANVYDGDTETPWVHLADRLGKPPLKCENVLVGDDGTVYVTTGDPYGRAGGLDGVVYRIRAD